MNVRKLKEVMKWTKKDKENRYITDKERKQRREKQQRCVKEYVKVKKQKEKKYLNKRENKVDELRKCSERKERK